ncbi:MAG: vanadium-dependent haloperoxidase [Mucilaginibacter polytrichastri]|nr:vanadium-dependent haloperoxidase [Mucilaginibacter polytrichastri]
MVSHKQLILLFLLLPFSPLKISAQGKKPVDVSTYYPVRKTVEQLSLVMLHDVVNPPAAARYYAYASLGAYQIVAANNRKIPPANTFLHAPGNLSVDTPSAPYSYQIAALYSILESGKLLLPSGYKLQDVEAEYLAILKKRKVPEAIIKSSVDVAEKMSAKILAYSKTDRYNRLSALVRYTPKRQDSTWYPTPPAYIEAVEPHWNTVRPVMIDSCNQFRPPLLVPFSRDSTSAFYKLVKEVYDIGQNLTAEQSNMAMFWDCNPFAVSTSGHMSIGLKKISPGGHWMSIASIASEKANATFDQHIVAITGVGLAIMDAFISSWDEKYRSNRIRPETYINRYMNIRWQPLLQTPPFPEYTSGHAVISNASAEVLTYLFGDKFAFDDDSERFFDLPTRSFTSFRQAATEASFSRVYGGIHYWDSALEGNKQGAAVGDFIVERLKKAGWKPF